MFSSSHSQQNQQNNPTCVPSLHAWLQFTWPPFIPLNTVSLTTQPSSFPYPSHTYTSTYIFNLFSIQTHFLNPLRVTTFNGPYTTIYLYPAFYPISMSLFLLPYLHGAHAIFQHGPKWMNTSGSLAVVSFSPPHPHYFVILRTPPWNLLPQSIG